MLIDRFNDTIDSWIHIIEQYSFQNLCLQSDANTWSIGQICIHLLNDTNWFIEQIKKCISSNDNAEETMSLFAQTIFANNSFPGERLANPANINMPQPSGKEDLLQHFIKLKKSMNEAAAQIAGSTFKGKTKHPGFNYLNATEWLQFAEIHMRHHLVQKTRIEILLQQHATDK